MYTISFAFISIVYILAMKISIFLSLLIVATVTCVTPIKVDNDYGIENAVDPPEDSSDYKTETETPKPLEVPKKQPPPIPKLAPLIYKTTTYPAPKNYEQPSGYSKVVQDVYATTQTPSPPLDYTPSPPVDYTEPPAKDVTPKQTLRAEDYRKPVAIKPPPAPTTVKAPQNLDPVDTFSLPESDLQTFSQDPTNVPQVSPTYLPPVAAVYNPYQYVARGGYTLQPVGSSPSYTTTFNVAPVSYRTIGIATPLTYATVPAARNFGYAFPSPSGLQVVYSTPSIAFNNGLTPLQYNGLTGGNLAFLDFLKKKRK